jgi:hypothetical protein
MPDYQTGSRLYFMRAIGLQLSSALWAADSITRVDGGFDVFCGVFM